ncbi:MAG: hypothetical protein M4579_007145 [Chaenotheca gracillima]|nr:MAG: hypothetical protein M4579_007145 [Chaenotheca gracillima]
MGDTVKRFVNCRQCIGGSLVDRDLCVSVETGRILEQDYSGAAEEVDLQGAIISPGFLEVQTNGLIGFHFTHYENDEQYLTQLRRVSEYLVSTGVTGYYPTVPTVSAENFQKILPSLKPRSFPNGADVLGAHAEGPFLAASRKGAHNEKLLHVPAQDSAETVYGAENLQKSVKIVTIAPELEGSTATISSLRHDYDIRVSLGHSAADYDTGVAGLDAGATMVTHIFNGMNPLHHRNPGLAGLTTSPPKPFYSVIPDGVHVHAAPLAMAYRANPTRCIVITDSIELAGLPDGHHPGHAQIPQGQRKQGNKATIEGTDTIIGSCVTLDECLRNLIQWTGCSVAEAVRCVTENVVELTGDQERGKLLPGRRADLVVLDDAGTVLQSWMRGKQVYAAT